MKKKIKVGMYLVDDTNFLYKVIEVFTNSVVVQSVADKLQDYSLEIMTFEAMENEKWTLLTKI